MDVDKDICAEELLASNQDRAGVSSQKIKETNSPEFATKGLPFYLIDKLSSLT